MLVLETMPAKVNIINRWSFAQWRLEYSPVVCQILTVHSKTYLLLLVVKMLAVPMNKVLLPLQLSVSRSLLFRFCTFWEAHFGKWFLSPHFLDCCPICRTSTLSMLCSCFWKLPPQNLHSCFVILHYHPLAWPLAYLMCSYLLFF